MYLLLFFKPSFAALRSTAFAVRPSLEAISLLLVLEYILLSTDTSFLLHSSVLLAAFLPICLSL